MAKRIATDQISFYDESLKKQIEGAYSQSMSVLPTAPRVPPMAILVPSST
jgi:hypothetical protein